MSSATVFTLKYRDTRPILEVTLKNPDGSVFDLTGATSTTLHVHLSDGTIVSRTMEVYGTATNGTLRYEWAADDWDADNVNGFLIVGPSLPLRPSEREHYMEYEVITIAGRLTFPNGSYHTLRITADIGEHVEVP